MTRTNAKTSRIIIPSIRKLTPNFSGCYYISIVVNDTKVHKSKPFEFKSPSNCEINQSFPLDPRITSIDKIQFQLYEKTTLLTTLICKGEVTRNKQTKDEFTNNFTCYLTNNNKENCILLYYNLEFIGENIFQTFTATANAITNANNRTSWITSLSNTNNNETHMLFTHNLEYLKHIITEIESIIKWKQYWKSASFLLITSFVLLQSKICFVFVSPLLLVLAQVYYSKHVDKAFIVKGNDVNTNNDLFYALLNAYNTIINTYEYCVRKCLNGNKRFVYELYLNIFKLFVMNIIVFYTPLLWFVSIKHILLLFIWGITLSCNPYVHSIYEFTVRLFKGKVFALLKSNNLCHTGYMHVVHLVQMVIPFYSLYVHMKHQEEKDVMQDPIFSFRNNDNINVNDVSVKRSSERKLSESNNSRNHMNERVSRSDSKRCTLGINHSGIKRLIKVELYENERWWVFVGWTKNVVMNEVQLWCKVSEPRTYCDKTDIEYQYDWVDEWKVETTDKTDEEGWEYSYDFNSSFSLSEIGKYVRRRKWVRYAN